MVDFMLLYIYIWLYLLLKFCRYIIFKTLKILIIEDDKDNEHYEGIYKYDDDQYDLDVTRKK